MRTGPGVGRHTIGIGLALIAIVASSLWARTQSVAGHEAAIRAARALSNGAIASHDVPGIARHWLPDVHIVSSTSAQGSGRDANGDRMAQQFARRPDTIYVRTPAAVEVLEPWAVASERGTWTGRWTEPDGIVEIAGTYLAQWRNTSGGWRIQAELFVPTSCRGSAYCRAHP
jgi:ketosteroid isomerase-like protein